MDELQELYRDVILDHNRHPRNFGELDRADRTRDGVNPLCGDKLTLYVNVPDGDASQDISSRAAAARSRSRRRR